MYPLTIGLAIETKELWEEVQSTLQELPVRVMIEQHEVGELADFLEKIDRMRPDVLLIDVTKLRDPLEHVIGRLKACANEPMVIAMHTSAEPELILGAVRAGAHEFLHPPLANNLRQALERRSLERNKNRERLRQKGRVMGFVSAKGGCGATTIACHIAAELGRQGKHVLLADMDLEAGIVRFLMKTKSPYSVMDALNNLHRLDQSYWNALISNGIPGLEIITAPEVLAAKVQPKQDQLQNMLSFIRTEYEFSVVDLGRSLSPMTMSALEEIDETYLVTTLDVPALHQAKQIVQTLREAGYGQNRVHLVLNRMPQRLDVTPEELEKMMSLPVFATLPNDYPALYDSYSEGTLLPPGSKLGRHLANMATKLAGLPEEKNKKKFSLFG